MNLRIREGGLHPLDVADQNLPIALLKRVMGERLCKVRVRRDVPGIGCELLVPSGNPRLQSHELEGELCGSTLKHQQLSLHKLYRHLLGGRQRLDERLGQQWGIGLSWSRLTLLGQDELRGTPG